MHDPRPALALLIGCALAAPAAAFTLHDALGEDQRSEALKVWIDERGPFTLAVDAKQPSASIELDVTDEEHRYRIEGESIASDGTRVVVAGAGVIVTPARMDRIAEAPKTAAEALAAYRALYATLARIAPPGQLEGLDPGGPAPATAAQVAAAEQRLGIALPPDYVRFVTQVGALRFANGSYVAARVYAPDELGTLADLVVRETRDNGWDEDWDALKRRIVKRFPKSDRNVVLDMFSIDEPTVLVRDGHCAAGEVAVVLPESDWELLATEPGDNPFVALIDYEDDIVGETQCFDYDRLFAYSLHDQLVELGDDVLYLRDGDPDDAAGIARGAEADGRVWVQLRDFDD